MVLHSSFNANESSMVWSFAESKLMDIAHRIDPEVVTAEFREDVLNNVALRVSFYKNLQNFKSRRDNEQYLRLIINPHTTTAELLNAYGKLLRVSEDYIRQHELNTQRTLMRDRHYSPGADIKKAIRIPSARTIAINLAPQEKVEELEKVLNFSLGLQAAARSWFILRKAQETMSNPEPYERDFPMPPQLTSIGLTYVNLQNILLTSDKRATEGHLTENIIKTQIAHIRHDLTKLFEESEIPFSRDVFNMLRVFGALSPEQVKAGNERLLTPKPV